MINFKQTAIEKYNATLIEFELQDGVIEPQEAFGTTLPEVPLNKGVILSGRGPIWFYARMVHHYHPARWIAVHDPRIGYIVVQSHTKERYDGEVLYV
jgi:CRISPR-associated protein Csx3